MHNSFFWNLILPGGCYAIPAIRSPLCHAMSIFKLNHTGNDVDCRVLPAMPCPWDRREDDYPSLWPFWRVLVAFLLYKPVSPDELYLAEPPLPPKCAGFLQMKITLLVQTRRIYPDQTLPQALYLHIATLGCIWRFLPSSSWPNANRCSCERQLFERDTGITYP